MAAACAAGWRRAVREVACVRAEEAAAEASHDEDRRRLERHVRRLETRHEHEAELLRRLRRSWEAERQWSRELRGQLDRLQHRASDAEEAQDLHGLVLRAAVALVEAEKGLLISYRDEDGDGELDVACSVGFERDPRTSAVAQRFARVVLAREEIVRDDDPGGGEGGADAEIAELVAIPVYLRDRFHGVIVCANRPGGFQDVDDDTLLALGEHAGAALRQGRVLHELEDARRATVRVLVEAVAARDPVLHRETRELAIHGGLLADAIGLDERGRDVVIGATLLRAVGYLPLPERLRLRAGPLTSDERALLALHPRLGFDILGQAPALHDVAMAVLYHHERPDGTGYPAGLAGEDIPLAARILAVLEAYGAMTNERPYRTPVAPWEACARLVEGGGTQFDPEVVALFVEQVRRDPRVARDDVAGAVLDALPLELGQDAGLVASVDGPTLLGNHARLQHDLALATRIGRPFGVVLVELEDLARVNEQEGHAAGDRLIDGAARAVRRAAARAGGTAYRVSGRRLAILVWAEEGAGAIPGIADGVRDEFIAGPSVRIASAAWSAGDTPAALLERARRALEAAGA
jgi:HD-GYP domain-containing protein (c-di-GMP phosphodiesterase class II)/GGDEF domain-containing protein